jgi:hypothetical protein
MSGIQKSITSAFDRVGRAAEHAIGTHERLLGQNPDNDVAYYETLKTPDFDHLAEVYGPDNVIEYIQAMESRRAKGKE